VGQGLGGWGGAAAGAALGSMILPGIGTAIGAALGGWGGSMGGEWAGSGLGSLFSGLFDDGTEKRRAELERAERASGARESAKAELAITVTDDRVKVRRVSSHGYDDISVDSGAYMPGVGR
jgi:phage tail tape-measure protein